MKKILLTLLIYIAYCIFVQCENDKLQESLVIATILSKTVNTVDPITLNENKKMQLLEENSNEIVLLSLNARKGMRGGEQILSISKYNSNKGTALHEIGHALGLIHEQQRRDRDEYININWDNIQSDKKSNFKIWEESHAVIKYIPDVLFDYKSIMLYPSYNSFAIDYSKPTMTKKDGSTFNTQRNNLSYIDIVAIYDIYGFPTGGGGPSVTSIK